ncbi:MAG: class I tRNA ligase family protein, partial [Lentisphaeraceae bacterium]|nr:class I tRNA ligase family protein [Lentisphaeraceae bacterium]
TALKELSISMAPFTPFFSEHIYRELHALDPNNQEPASVHLCDYPVSDESKINTILEQAVDRMNQIILLGRQKRNQVKIKVKTPLRRLTVIHKDQALLDEIAKLEGYIKSELNVKTIEYDQAEENYISFFAKANFKVLGKRLGKEMGKYAGMIKKLSSEQLAAFEAAGTIELAGQAFDANDIEVLREAKEGHDAISNSLITIDMDCELDDELIGEGLAREVISRIQKTRKDLDFKINDRIAVTYSASDGLASAMVANADYICRETLSLELVAGVPAGNAVEFKVDAHELQFSISVVSQ